MKSIKEKKKEHHRLRKSAKTKRVTQRKRSSGPVCRLCLREPGDPEKLGEFLQKDDLSVHYFCLKYAHTSAKHFFKCPQCNNRDEFPQEMLRMGIHIPDRDAAWELEPGAFSELYQRYQHCDAPICLYERGRDSSEEEGKWRIILCATCGSHGTHRNCSSLRSNCKKWECMECAPAARAIECTLEDSGDIPCCSSTCLSRGHFYRDTSLEENPGPSWTSWPGSSLLENPESSGPRSHSWESKGVTVSKSCKKSE